MNYSDHIELQDRRFKHYTCSECGDKFEEDQVIEHNGGTYCHECDERLMEEDELQTAKSMRYSGKSY
jgi:DNA-directed RNA polymerase subunit RPC12/RpoP